VTTHPDLPAATRAEVHVLVNGYVGMRVASTVSLILDGDARIVVDPGMVSRQAVILEPLAALGVAPAEVSDVVLSHHHPDHTLNAGLFPNARVHDYWAVYQGDRWEDRRAQRAARAVQLHVARRCDRLITVSRAARDDFVARLGLDPLRIDVVPLGVGGPPACKALGLPGDYPWAEVEGLNELAGDVLELRGGEQPVAELLDLTLGVAPVPAQGTHAWKLPLLRPPRHRLRRNMQQLGHLGAEQIPLPAGLGHMHPSPGLLSPPGTPLENRIAWTER
jgi:hypothetical protein